MKNSSGSARRNFFRSSSRRLRVGPGGSGAQGGVGGPTAAAGAGAAAAGQQQQQQSLIAGGRPAGKQKQAAGQLSPLEAGEQHALAGQPQQGAALHQHNSPSEFGGSSSGGFTYFSGKFSASLSLKPSNLSPCDRPSDHCGADRRPAAGEPPSGHQCTRRLLLAAAQIELTSPGLPYMTGRLDFVWGAQVWPARGGSSGRLEEFARHSVCGAGRARMGV